jgi:hypothetical protein
MESNPCNPRNEIVTFGVHRRKFSFQKHRYSLRLDSGEFSR